jgi:2-oxoacid:acceptor oxidoreductase gamma subunit (pyruvate/2-ketoisovalerate family)
VIEIKFIGRGGQGVVVASEVFARACFEEGLYPQSFAIYGGERRGAVVAAFVRTDTKKIYLKCDIDYPDHLVLFDGSLFNADEIARQVKPGGTLLLNGVEPQKAGALKGYRIGLINAIDISRQNGLGTIVNTTVLGAYTRLTGLISIEGLLKVIKGHIPAAIDQNMAAAREAYEQLTIL